jgi:hypothetical protein
MITKDHEVALLQEPFHWPKIPTMILKCKTAISATAALNRVREVLLEVLPRTPGSGLSLDRWRVLLPSWFVQEFAQEPTVEELKVWTTVPVEERAKLRSNWPLSSWIYWFDEEDERIWRWQGSKVVNDYEFWIALDLEEDPSPTGALEWLLEASGVKYLSREIGHKN